MDSAEIERRMRDAKVPALAVAIVRDGKLASVETFGFADPAASRPVDDASLFEAASLGKPVFAYAVMKLVDEGAFSLDEPLSHFLPDYVPDDARAAQITARHVLSHTCGFPNWGTDALPLRTYFAPGSRYSYSGEGYLYLQRALKRVTGQSLDEFVRQRVFAPLGMARSHFNISKLPADVMVTPHDEKGEAMAKAWTGPNAASSLHTTAADYALFLEAVVNRSGLKTATAEAWMAPNQTLPARFADSLDPHGDPKRDPSVAWGLGWGIETASPVFFQWGAHYGAKSLAIGSMRTRDALVLLSSGHNAMPLAAALAAELLSGDRPSLHWLEFV